MRDVHLVLDKFDDRQDEVRVAKPAEDIVEDTQVLILHAPRDAMGEGRKDNAMNLGKLCLDSARHGESIVVGITRHTNDEVDACRGKHLLGFLYRRDLRESRWIAESKLHIFIVDLLFHASVVLKHESIVGIGYNQHIINMSRHDIDESDILEDKLRPFLRYLCRHRN